MVRHGTDVNANPSLALVIGGLLMLLNGVILLFSSSGAAFLVSGSLGDTVCLSLGLCCSALSLLGGLMAIIRKYFLIAVSGAIVPTVLFFSLFAYEPDLNELFGIFLFLGVESLVSLVLVLVSRNEFDGEK